MLIIVHQMDWVWDNREHWRPWQNREHDPTTALEMQIILDTTCVKELFSDWIQAISWSIILYLWFSVPCIVVAFFKSQLLGEKPNHHLLDPFIWCQPPEFPNGFSNSSLHKNHPTLCPLRQRVSQGLTTKSRATAIYVVQESMFLTTA